MAATFLDVVSGKIKQIVAVVTSSGAADADKLISTDANGKIDLTLMPTGIGPDTKEIVASESLSAGDIVNIWDNAGTPNVRKADAATGKAAHGFVLSAVAASGTATVYFEGVITGLTGLTPAAEYFLSGATPGAVTATPVSTSGYLSQVVGVAVSATELSFEPSQGITLA